jgi:hypothetical protein
MQYNPRALNSLRCSRLALPDLLALLLSLLAVGIAALVARQVYENMPHFEDEMAYAWQAQALASGHLTLPSPPHPKSFLVPFVIDHGGQRFSKYPLGWPTVLAIGLKFGLRDWVNPLLAGFGVWLIYLLGKKLLSRWAALLAAALAVTAPFFWLLSGSLLSHIWSLVLTLGFALAWLDSFGLIAGEEEASRAPHWLTTLVAGLSLGVLGLTRPITAIGVGLPFAFHGLILLGKGNREVRLRVLTIGVLAASVGLLLFVWQYAVTGDPLQNPYALWWPYDKYGFGLGNGRFADGHNLTHAWDNLRYSLFVTGKDILGWGNLWGVFLPFGLWAVRRKRGAWLVGGVFPGLILAYLPYWIGSWQYGPRYYFEGLPGLALLSSAGIFWLAGVTQGSRLGVARQVLVGTVLVILVSSNLFGYLPDRLRGMVGMYEINRAQLAPFQTSQARALTPALVVVHFRKIWTEYGGLLELENAQLTSPFIFALSQNDTTTAELAEDFPSRRVFDYYPNSPDALREFPP